MAHDLCIIGQEKNESDLRLLEEAKKRFSSVFFVPVNGIGVGLTNRFSISYRTTDLFKFPAVLARIPPAFSSYAYQLLSLFPEQTYMPIRPLSFLLAEERFFLLTVLRKRGVDTINLRLATSKRAAERILEESDFPLIVRTSEEKTGVIVNNTTEAKSIIDALASLNKPILIEDVIKEIASLYVANPELVATAKKKTKERDVVFAKGSLKAMKASIELEHVALQAASAVETTIARVDVSLEKEPRVVNIDLNPNLILPSQATGVDVPSKIMHAVEENFESHRKKPMLIKFFEDAESVVKDVLKAKPF